MPKPTEPLYLPNESSTEAFKRWLKNEGFKLSYEDESLVSYAWASGMAWGLKRGMEPKKPPAS